MKGKNSAGEVRTSSALKGTQEYTQPSWSTVSAPLLLLICRCTIKAAIARIRNLFIGSCLIVKILKPPEFGRLDTVLRIQPNDWALLGSDRNSNDWNGKQYLTSQGHVI